MARTIIGAVIWIVVLALIATLGYYLGWWAALLPALGLWFLRFLRETG